MSKYQPVYDMYNAKLHPLLMNVHNFEVISVRPYNGVDGINTVIDLRVDRSIDQDGNVVEGYEDDNRYFERSVEMQRFDLADVITEDIKSALRDAIGINVGPSGAVATDDETYNIVNNGAVRLKVMLTPSDVKFVRVTDDENPNSYYFVMVAKEDSIGFIGSVSLKAAATAPVDPEPEPEVIPWATAADIDINMLLDAAGDYQIHAAKYGDTIKLRHGSPMPETMRFKAYVANAGAVSAVEVIANKNDMSFDFVIPPFTNNGQAYTQIIIANQHGQQMQAGLPIFMMNATVDESTLALGDFSGPVATSRMEPSDYLPATVLQNWTGLNLLRADGSALETGDSNSPFPRTLHVTNLVGDGRLETMPSTGQQPGGYSFDVRSAFGTQLTAHLDMNLEFVINKDLPTTASKSTGIITAYADPEYQRFQVRDEAQGMWTDAFALAEAPGMSLTNETSISLRFMIAPAEWASKTGFHYSLVSATGEANITIDDAQDKILFGTPVGDMVNADIDLVIRAGLEQAAPATAGGTTPMFYQDYPVKLKRVVGEQSQP